MTKKSPASKSARFETHEHVFVTGPRRGARLVHSHEGGDTGHTHPDTGPGRLTMDRDEWFRATGLPGGGRKKFTAKPKGEQLPAEPWSCEVRIVRMARA